MTCPGNITQTTNEDGALWDYEYDGRYRLTKAVRKNASTPTITATYEYTYDDGDNLVTKVTPFFDDFDDGDYNGWSTYYQWDASNGYLSKTSTANYGDVRVSNTNADVGVRFSYLNEDTSTSTLSAPVKFRFVDWNNFVQVSIQGDRMKLVKRVGGTYSTITENTSATTTQDTWYDVRILCEGSDVTVWRGLRGGQMSQVLSTNAAPFDTDTQTLIRFGIGANAYYRFDNIELITDDQSRTTTYAYNNANELTSMAFDNGTTSFYYDDWGRTISKSLEDYDATYYYRYGGTLYAVTSDFPDEGTVNYNYGGDGKRRQRTVGGTSTWYNWDSGWNVINEENSQGTLTMTYIGKMAQVPGSSPSTGSYAYYMHDHLGSTRALYDQSKNNTALYEFTPYGDMYANSGSGSTTHLYAGYPWDNTSQLYYLPLRYYSPNAARWITSDPLGMLDGPNMYAYVMGNPIVYNDQSGGGAFVLVTLFVFIILVIVGDQAIKKMDRGLEEAKEAAKELPHSDVNIRRLSDRGKAISKELPPLMDAAGAAATFCP